MSGRLGWRPTRLANTPTIRHCVPASSPAGGRSLCSWLPALGTANRKGSPEQGESSRRRYSPPRLLPLEGAVAVRRLRVLGAGAVYRLGLDNARDKRLPFPAPCKYPYHQALRASFLPRWGKKPFLLAVFFGKSQPKAPSIGGRRREARAQCAQRRRR